MPEVKKKFYGTLSITELQVESASSLMVASPIQKAGDVTVENFEDVLTFDNEHTVNYFKVDFE